MIIKPFTTYNTLATIEFDTIYGNRVVCTIKSRGKVITPKTFIATGDPLEINLLPGTDTFTVIRGVEAILKVNNQIDLDFFKLLPNGNKDYLIEITYNGNEIFTGYMNPDQYFEPFNTPPYQSEVTFVDGISFLKETDFADINGCYYTGYFTDAHIIGYCLSEIGINRNIVDCINIYDQSTDPADEFGTLFEKRKNAEAFKGLNCYDVINEILKSHTARIELINNKYVIRRINSNEETLNGIEYQMNENSFVSIVESTTFDNMQRLTGAQEALATRAVFVGSSQQLGRIEGAKKLIVNQNYGRKESIIQRSLFTECDFDGDGRLKGWDSFFAIRRSFEDENAVHFLPISNPSITTRPYINAITIDDYSDTGVTADEETRDYFNLDFVLRNPVPGGVGDYIEGSAITAGKGLTANNTTVIRLQESAPARQEFNVNVRDLSGILCFSLNAVKFQALYNISANDIMSGYRIYYMFTNDENRPINAETNVPYRVVGLDYQVTTQRLFFNLIPVDDLLQKIVLETSEEGNQYQGTFSFSYLPVNLTAPGTGNLKLSTEGKWLSNAFIILPLPESGLKQNDFFSIGLISKLPLIGCGTGKFEIEITKPLPNVFFEDEIYRFFIESMRLTIVDTPENKKETITLNNKLRNDYELNLMFAETPIKNNFINNKLKFYNNYFSKSLINAPGLQAVKSNGNYSSYTTIYNYIKQVYSDLLKKYRNNITGTLDAPQLNLFARCIDDPDYTEKSYIPNSCRWNLKNQKFEVDLHEIGKANDVPFRGDFSDDYSNDFENQ